MIHWTLSEFSFKLDWNHFAILQVPEQPSLSGSVSTRCAPDAPADLNVSVTAAGIMLAALGSRLAEVQTRSRSLQGLKFATSSQ